MLSVSFFYDRIDYVGLEYKIQEKKDKYMKKGLLIAGLLIAAALCLPSCNGKPKKTDIQASPPATTEKSTVPVKAPRNRTSAELIANLPCKIDTKKGAFAVFPDNPVAGQNCFGLYTPGKPDQKIQVFDIMTDGMYIIFHDAAGAAPQSIKLMQWENRDGRPCMEKACGKQVPTRTESRNAPGNDGWTYTIATPLNPADLISGGKNFYGIVINEENQLPLFF